MNKLLLRKIHRWLGLFAGIQLLAWTVSGLYFTLIPISDIHGDHLLDKEVEHPPTISAFNLMPLQLVVSQNDSIRAATLSEASFTATLGKPVYLIANQRFDAETGKPLAELSRVEAEQIAKARSSHEPLLIERVTEVPVDDEYRGGELPAWRITLEVEDAAIYVGANTGRVRAVRTNAWRLFDFLWSLHIMDYEDREDFNHWLIKLLAALGLVTVLSGLTLFVVTQRWRSPLANQ